MGGLHPDLVRLFEGQLGMATLAQCDGLGLSAKALRRRERAGEVVRRGRRVVALAGVPGSYESDVLAACLDLGGVASHRTAARLHGLAGFERCTTVEVTVPRGTGPSRSSLAEIHWSTNLGPDDLVEVGPIPTTSVARTFLGLAALTPDQVSHEQLRDALDVAARDQIVSDRWLWWRLEKLRCRGRNGVRALERALVARADLGPTESWLERQLLELLRDAGLPLPAVQRRIRRSGAFVARVDCCYDELRLVIEVNGYRSHSTRAQVAADDARRNALVLAGYEVLTFGYDAIVAQPSSVVAAVRDALDARSPRAGPHRSVSGASPNGRSHLTEGHEP